MQAIADKFSAQEADILERTTSIVAATGQL
jgi:hypothetical protein